MAEAQLAPLIGRDRQPHAALRHKIKVGAWIAAREHHLALGEAGLAKQDRAGGKSVGREGAEQPCTRQ